MLFLIRIGTSIPWYGPSGGVGVVIGVTKAKSRAVAARQLGLIRWSGWKKIPMMGEISRENWEKWGKKYFYTPFDTKGIDRSPEKYASINWRMRVITLEQVIMFEGPISREVWCRF